MGPALLGQRGDPSDWIWYPPLMAGEGEAPNAEHAETADTALMSTASARQARPPVREPRLSGPGALLPALTGTTSSCQVRTMVVVRFTATFLMVTPRTCPALALDRTCG
ncbi:hypothetical protein HMPREF1550_01979 [Actinomyces sp. oral taxon 877 str. F0543]|nr:hypothetical protein HMPREF1550_01979 [Actinomyces sp. oral taxon 877 str. F0543]